LLTLSVFRRRAVWATLGVTHDNILLDNNMVEIAGSALKIPIITKSEVNNFTSIGLVIMTSCTVHCVRSVYYSDTLKLIKYYLAISVLE